MIDQLFVAAGAARDADDSSSGGGECFVIQSRFCATDELRYSKGVYLPAAFHETDIPRLHGLMRARPLATLVTLDADGVVADHIPMQVLGAAEAPSAPRLGILRGHVARAQSAVAAASRGQRGAGGVPRTRGVRITLLVSNEAADG